MNKKYYQFFKSPTFISILATLLFELVLLLFSFKEGRLAVVPTYDDVVYLLEGKKYFLELQQNGIGFFIKNMLEHPPLSPYMVLITMSGFSLFGINAWGPYILHGAFIFVFIRLLFCYFKKDYIALLLFSLSMPMLGYWVIELRPDILNGFSTAIACATLLLSVLHNDYKKSIFLPKVSGVAFGLALLFKPSASIFTLGLYLLTCLCILIVYVFSDREVNFKKVLVDGLLLGIAIAFPFYFYAFDDIYQYTYNALVIDKDIWAIDISVSEHLKFYLTGHGGHTMLGSHFYLIFFLTLYFIFFLFRKKSHLSLLISLIIITFFAWLVPTSNVVKTEFLAAAFYWLYFFTCLIAFKLYRDEYENAGYSSNIIILVGAIIIFIVDFRFIPKAEAVHPQTQNQIVFEKLRNRLSNIIETDLNKQWRIVFPYTGYINAHSMSFSLAENGYSNYKILHPWLHPDDDVESKFKDLFNTSDIAVVATPNKKSILINMYLPPAAKSMSLINGLLKSDGRFQLQHEIQANDNQTVKIYLKK